MTHEDFIPANADLAMAFPSSVRREALEVLSEFPPVAHGSKTFSAWLDHEEVRIPWRIYHDQAQIPSKLSTSIQDEIVACLLTRHHDGLIRQQNLRSIFGSKNQWTVPFVVQLAGEYVIEIITDIQASLPTLDKEQYSAFLHSNRDLLVKTEQRTRSYWNCYYRDRFSWDSYPGRDVINYFNNLAELNH